MYTFCRKKKRKPGKPQRGTSLFNEICSRKHGKQRFSSRVFNSYLHPIILEYVICYGYFIVETDNMFI